MIPPETDIEIHNRLYKTETVGFYVVRWSDEKKEWELRRRLMDSDITLFVASDMYKTTLIMTANRLQGELNGI